MLAVLVALATLSAMKMVTMAGKAEAATNAKTTLTIQAEGVDLSGTVQSAKLSCLGNRTVKVYNAAQGGGLYSSTKSNSAGEWTIPAGSPNGTFYAAAKQRSIDTGSKILVCKRAVSQQVTF